METGSKSIDGYVISNSREVGIHCENNHVYSCTILKANLNVMGDMASCLLHSDMSVKASNPIESFLGMFKKVNMAHAPFKVSKFNPKVYISVDEEFVFCDNMFLLIDYLSNYILESESYFKIKKRKEPIYGLHSKTMYAGIIADEYYYDNKYIYFEVKDSLTFISIDNLNECDFDNPLDKPIHFYNDKAMLGNYMIELYESEKDEFESYDLSAPRKIIRELKEGDIVYMDCEDGTIARRVYTAMNKYGKFHIDTGDDDFEIDKGSMDNEAILSCSVEDEDDELMLFTSKVSYLEYKMAQHWLNIIKTFVSLGLDLAKLHA